MARFLFVTYAAAGHLTPALTVAAALRRRGHDVAMLTSERAAKSLESHDITLLPARRWPGTLERIPAQKGPNAPLPALLRLRRTIREVLFADAVPQVDDLRAALESWPADLVISSDITAGVSLAMESLGRPWATLAAQITCPLPSRELPPWGLALPLPKTSLERKRAELARRVLTLASRSVVREWVKLRRSFGLAEKNGDLAQLLASPFLYLVPSSPDFDYPRSDLPAEVHYIGPCLPASAADAAWQSPFSAAPSAAEKPLIYATAGTVHNDPAFLARWIEAARGEDFNLFLTLGKDHPLGTWNDLPPNVRLATFVPQDLVLRQASAVLCNGGSGAVMGALVHGCPLVLVPLAADQPENARRCEERGVGVLVKTRPLEPTDLREALRRVLADRGFRDRAARLAVQLSRLEGPARGAALLERSAASGEPVFRSRERLDAEVLAPEPSTQRRLSP